MLPTTSRDELEANAMRKDSGVVLGEYLVYASTCSCDMLSE